MEGHFPTDCHKYRTVLSKKKITVGGMITLIGLFKGAKVSKEDPVDMVYTYTERKMVTGEICGKPTWTDTGPRGIAITCTMMGGPVL